MGISSGGGRYLPQLDGVRAAAVLMVVAFHARGAVFPGGYIGVDVFFVLSGYLITGILLRELHQTGALSMRRFYIRRALRLLPALFLVCGVIAAAYLALPGAKDRGPTLLGTLGAISYTSSPLAASGQDLGAMLHTWSLSVEEYFYLLWPVLLVLIRRWAKSWTTAIFVLTFIAIAYRFAGHAVFDWSGQRLSYGADTRCEQLLIGASLAAVPATIRGRIPTWAVLAFAGALGVYVLLPEHTTGGFYVHSGSTVIALMTAVVIGRVGGEPSRMSRILSWTPLVWIGQRSYGIYLWNPPMIALVAMMPLGDSVQLATKLALTFLIPALSYAYVEKPFLRLKDRFEPDAPKSGDRERVESRAGGPHDEKPE